MSLNKKDFKKVAEILNKYITDKDFYITTIPLKLLYNDFIEYFKSENPKFDEQKFKDAVLKD